MTALAVVPQPGDPLARLLTAYLDGCRSPNTADTANWRRRFDPRPGGELRRSAVVVRDN